jgi:hypothetical protein
MLLRVILDIVPYFAIAAICLGILAAWILRANVPSEKGILSQVSPRFLVGLAILLFITFLLASVSSIIENSRIRRTIAMQKGIMAKMALAGVVMEKDAARLKREIGELRAQKALYTATIETLAKK